MYLPRLLWDFPDRVAGKCEFTAISSFTKCQRHRGHHVVGHELERDKAAPSLRSREHSGALECMVKRSHRRLRTGGSGQPVVPRKPRIPACLEFRIDGRREPALPGRNGQWTTIPASRSPRVDAGRITWRPKEVDERLAESRGNVNSTSRQKRNTNLRSRPEGGPGEQRGEEQCNDSQQL